MTGVVTLCKVIIMMVGYLCADMLPVGGTECRENM